MNLDKQPSNFQFCTMIVSIVLSVSFATAFMYLTAKHDPKALAPVEHSNPTTAHPVAPTTTTTPNEDLIHNMLGITLYIDQSCYDSVTKIWLVHSPEHENSEDNWDTGWYIEKADAIQYVALGNGTLLYMNADDTFNQDVIPDITGLSCKPHIQTK
jgi:hypothetical protein